MANKVLTKKQKKKLKKQLGGLHGGYIAVTVLFLLAGIVIGAFFAMKATESDLFTLNGAAMLVYTAGEEIRYTDEGVRCISMGKDVSDNFEVTTNMSRSQDGAYTASAPGEYYLKYTMTEGRYKGLSRVRIITVTV